MDLGLFNVSDTYQYVLNQSGANAITLGNGNAVNWNAGGVVALTGNQSISGEKYFNDIISAPNVYITNNSPGDASLEILGNGYVYLDLTKSPETDYSFRIITDGSNRTSIVTQSGPLVFQPSGTEKMRISSNGNVGIGTASPTQTLHVTGSIYANSFTGNSFTGNSFIGNSFIGNSFTLQNTGIKLLSRVSLTTANIWYDVTGLSGALSPGTWLVNAMALYSGSATASNAAFRVLNSTSGTVYASAMNFHTTSSSDLSTTNISTIINLTSTTTVKLQALSSSISANIIASGTGLANSGSCSQISFVKIS